MSLVMDNTTLTFSGVTYEDEIPTLRDYLQLSSPAHLIFDFVECDDLHLGILQLLLAYKKRYSAEYRFGTHEKLYQKVCEGFETSEVHCA